MFIDLTHEQKMSMFTEIFEYYVRDGIKEFLRKQELKNKCKEEIEGIGKDLVRDDMIECFDDTEIDFEELADEAVDDIDKEITNLRLEEDVRDVEEYEYQLLYKERDMLVEFLGREQ